ncbi:isoprenoid biosynthesis protein ElbB, partial [Candidatus Poribacteria bacterium]|nr:isoprenoid biosynthesis protein ElbB [Candidatus Poribacteria bacterium]
LIARGMIRDAATVMGAVWDALVFPGGFGAAKNLCKFATDGADCHVNPEAARLIKEMHDARKPLGFVCISPALCAKVLAHGVEVTIGNDEGTATAIRKMGGKHAEHSVTEVHHDAINNVVSTPAYMYGGSRPGEVYAGIEKLAQKIVALIK